MEKFIYKNNIEHTSLLLDELIKVAKDNAPTEDELNSPDFSNDKLNLASVLVKTLPEFKILLSKLNLKESDVIDILDHENAHANKAEFLIDKGKMDIEIEGYAITFIKDGNEDRFIYQPRIRVIYPENLSQTEKSNFRKQVIFAPEEYGNELSENDKKMLDGLK